MIDPDTGIPDLIRRLTDDSKRLVTDEVRLAKLEAKDSLHRAARGGIWLALAFGVSIVTLVALTVFVVDAHRPARERSHVGRRDGHRVIELAVGAWLLKRGLSTYAEPSYTLAETRGALADTAHWASAARQR